MTFSGRIRTYLVAVAVLPPLLILSVIYFFSIQQLDQSDRRQAEKNLSKVKAHYAILQQELKSNVDALIAHPDFNASDVLTGSSRAANVGLDAQRFGLSFVELVDRDFRVLASSHRPGLVGESIHQGFDTSRLDSAGFVETVEYDLNGAHASLSYVRPMGDGLSVYAGKYIEERYQQQLASLLDARVECIVESETTPIYGRFQKEQLYFNQDTLQALLAGGDKAGFYLVASFNMGGGKSVVWTLMKTTGVVALVSVLVALALGMFVTGKAKREMDNLVEATSRVAAGDFSVPVMAYEEGEFSQLADAFSDMMRDLKALQKKLSTSEKIAAWQVMGRKIAHEIRNPLMPIAIGADDLRNSYRRNVPDFDKVLEETTGVIKSEVARMNKLLDHFVGFARMSASVIRSVRSGELVDAIKALYRPEIESGRLKITNDSHQQQFSLDPDTIKQVLVNLIKNGFESSDNATVKIRISDDTGKLTIEVEDDGPGFSDKKLADSFEPFESTKEKGSGLGLVICHRIVHDHGGSLELYNRKEGGGGVRISLPR